MGRRLETNDDSLNCCLIGGIVLLLLVIGLLLAQQSKKRTLREKYIQYVRALNLADVDHMNGLDFEHYVGRLLAHRGFQVKLTQPSSDLGVDIIARKGNLKYAIQVKRQTKPVSRRAVSDAVAGKAPYGCNAAMVVTNNYFSNGAIKLAKSTGCELIARDTLAEWILDFQTPKIATDSAKIRSPDTEAGKELDQPIATDQSPTKTSGDKVSPQAQQIPRPRFFFSKRTGQWLILILLGILVIGVWGFFFFLILRH